VTNFLLKQKYTWQNKAEDHGDVKCSPEEAHYLCELVSEYFAKPVTPDDIVWTYSGVRPLYDDGKSTAARVTRDYVLDLEEIGGAPLLNIFGGKITTYRKLSEEVLEKLQPNLPEIRPEWTAAAPLPGGDFPVDAVARLTTDLQASCAGLGAAQALRLVRAYGTQAKDVIGNATDVADLGRDFGAGLTEAELRWLVKREWAVTADDVLWRRTKLGLRVSKDQAAEIENWLKTNVGPNRTSA